MRTTIRTIAAMSAAILALVSCTKEPAGSKNVNPADGSRVFTLSFNATKTALKDDGKTPEFVNGDQIKVFNGESNVTLPVTVKDGKATVTVPGSISGDFKAVYPATAWQAEAPYFQVKNIQDGTFANANICLAEVKEGDKNITFNNQTVLFTFDVASYAGTYIHVISARENIANTDAYDKQEGDEGYNAHKSILNRVVVTGEAITAIKNSESVNKICYISILPSGTLKCKDLSFANGTHIKVAKDNTTTLARNNFFTVKMNDGWTEPYVEFNDLKWATKNIGATESNPNGDHFAWGEVKGHKWSGTPNYEGNVEGAFTTDFASFDHTDARYTGTWSAGKGFADCNTPYYDGLSKTDAYSTSKYNNGEGKKVLDLSDDAANVNWGGSWRMPTFEELSAFIVDTEGFYNPGANGSFTHHEVTFPAAALGSGTSLLGVGESYYGTYWSSSLSTDDPGFAYDLSFGEVYVEASGAYRRIGHSVRAISD